MPTTDHSASALAVRPPGDVIHRHQSEAGSLSQRAGATVTLISGLMIAAGTISLGTCNGLSHDRCEATIDAAIPIVISLGLLGLYDYITGDRQAASVELKTAKEKYENTKKEGEVLDKTLEDLRDKLPAEKSQRAHTEVQNQFIDWKNAREKFAIEWKQSAEPKMKLIDWNVKYGGAPFKNEAEWTRGNYTAGLKAAQMIEEASLLKHEPKSLAEWLQGIADDPDNENGVPSLLETHVYMYKASESMDSLLEKMAEYSKKSAEAYEEAHRLLETTVIPDTDTTLANSDVYAVPGAWPSDQEELVNGRSRRSWTHNLPRLVSETMDDCDNQLCHRLWVSHSVPPRRSRRDQIQEKTIHHVYYTPLDFDWNEHGKLVRRSPADGSDDDSDDGDDGEYECDSEQTIIGGDNPIVVKLALVSGGDDDSLATINRMNGTQVTELKSETKKHFDEINKGQWQCAHIDTPNGGKPAAYGVYIASTDSNTYGQDVKPLLEKCKTKKLT